MYSVIPTVVLRSPVFWRLVPNFHINVQGWDSSYCSHLINLRIQLFFFLKQSNRKSLDFSPLLELRLWELEPVILLLTLLLKLSWQLEANSPHYVS